MVHGEKLPFPAFRVAVLLLLDLYLASLWSALHSLFLAAFHSCLFLYSFSAIARKDATVDTATITNHLWSLRFGSELGSLSFFFEQSKWLRIGI